MKPVDVQDDVVIYDIPTQLYLELDKQWLPSTRAPIFGTYTLAIFKKQNERFGFQIKFELLASSPACNATEHVEYDAELDMVFGEDFNLSKLDPYDVKEEDLPSEWVIKERGMRPIEPSGLNRDEIIAAFESEGFTFPKFPTLLKCKFMKNPNFNKATKISTDYDIF